MPKPTLLSRQRRVRVTSSLARGMAIGAQVSGIGIMALGGVLLWHTPDGWGGVLAFAGFAAVIYASLLIKAPPPR